MVTKTNIKKKKDLVLETKGEVWAYNQGFIEGYKRALTEIKTFSTVNLRKFQSKIKDSTK